MRSTKPFLAHLALEEETHLPYSNSSNRNSSYSITVGITKEIIDDLPFDPSLSAFTNDSWKDLADHTYIKYKYCILTHIKTCVNNLRIDTSANYPISFLLDNQYHWN